MKYACLCLLIWMAHVTLNALEGYVPRPMGDLEKRNACIDLFAEASSWKYSLCSKQDWGKA